MKATVCGLIWISFFGGIIAHSVLKSPEPWNANEPSKGAPCPGVRPSGTNNLYETGKNIAVVWDVVAQDGEGQVNVRVSTDGTTSAFTNNAATLVNAGSIAGSNLNSLGLTSGTINIPTGTVCTAPDKLCVVQFATTSNWFSCMLVNLSTVAVPAPAPPTVVCKVMSGLSFCANRNGVNVAIEQDIDPLALDAQTNITYSANVHNPNVFGSGNSSQCEVTYRQFICDNTYPDCGQVAACVPECNLMRTVCNITAEHSALYPCTTGPATCDTSSTTTTAAKTTATTATAKATATTTATAKATATTTATTAKATAAATATATATATGGADADGTNDVQSTANSIVAISLLLVSALL